MVKSFAYYRRRYGVWPALVAAFVLTLTRMWLWLGGRVR